MRTLTLGLLLAGLFTTPVHAAISVTYETNALNLANALIGSGITLSGSPTFIGNTGINSGSAGIFTGGAPSIGIASGILLTTGNAKNAEGPNTADNSSAVASGAGDPDIAGSLDSSSLEFKFTSTGGNLFFNYVFASEEYNEWAPSNFNDAFGFFLDGVNIALIPSTMTPVSINTVNASTNSIYYNNNDLQDAGGWLAELGYDGFTDVFTASVIGLAAGEHTIRLVISDRGDDDWDSGVFLQANTFSDTPTPVVPEPASLLIWSLLGTALGAAWWRRRRAAA